MNIGKLQMCAKSRARRAPVCLACVMLIITVGIFYIPNKVWNSTERNIIIHPVISEQFTAYNCSPKDNIFFLKTHKCASSTVQNIFLRYGARKGLNFVLPTLGNYLGNQAPFMRAMAAVSPWHRLGYNIFCHHTVFEEKEIAAIMPSDTIYISIVRHPVMLFESLYSYARLDLHYKQSLEEFALNQRPGPNIWTDRSEGYLGVNQMAYDFGIRPKDFGNLSKVHEILHRLDNRFALVLVAEYFDESMILLKELLCWPMKYVTYFRHNARKAEAKQELKQQLIQSLENLNSLDMLLYKHFLTRFKERIKKFGSERMQKEVQQLRRMNAELENFCVDRVVQTSARRGPFQLFSDQVDDLTLKVNSNNRTCSSLARSELSFSSHLKMIQILKAVRLLNRQGKKQNRRNKNNTASLNPLMFFKAISKEMGYSSINITQT